MGISNSAEVLLLVCVCSLNEQRRHQLGVRILIGLALASGVLRVQLQIMNLIVSTRGIITDIDN